MKTVEIKGVKPRVAKILEKNQKARTDDGYVTGLIWYDDLVSKGIDKDTAIKIGKLVASGELTNTESIRRCRQKLQSENPDLYGSYEDRKARQEEIKNQLRK